MACPPNGLTTLLAGSKTHEEAVGRLARAGCLAVDDADRRRRVLETIVGIAGDYGKRLQTDPSWTGASLLDEIASGLLQSGLLGPAAHELYARPR